MTDDITRIGLQVDSSQVAQGKTALDQFAGAAGPAAAGANNFQRAAAGAAVHAKAAATNTGLARHELVNLGRQAQDVGTMLAMGASPFSILASQGAQVFDIFSSSQGTLRGFASQVASVITPVRLLGGGLAAAGVAAYAFNAVWKSSALQLDDTSRAIGTTISQLRGLEAAASVKGIDNFSQASERFADNIYDANSGMGRLAELLRANGLQAGSFVDTLARVAELVRRAGNDQERLQILRQAGLPADMQWVRFMQQGGDAVRRAASEATNFGSRAEQDMIRKAREFDEAWNRSWQKFKSGVYEAVQYAKGEIQKLDEKGEEFRQEGGIAGWLLKFVPNYQSPRQRTGVVGPSEPWTDRRPLTIQNVQNAFGRSDVIDPDKAKNDLQREQQRIQALGNLATVTEQVRSKEIELQLARLAGSNITDADTRRILAHTEAQALGTLAIRQQAETVRIETQASEMGVGAAAAFRIEQEKLAEWRRLGIKATDEQVTALHREAAALGQVTQAAAERRAVSDQNFALAQLGRTDTEQQVATQMRQLYGEQYQQYMNGAIAGQVRLNSALTETKSIAAGAFETIANGFAQGASKGEIFGRVLQQIGNKMIGLGSNQFASMLTGGLGSLFGGGTGQGNPFPTPIDWTQHNIAFPTPIMHGGYGPGDRLSGRYVHPAYFDDAPRFHTGIGPGERPAVLRNDESVLTPGQMSQLAPAGEQTAVSVNLSIDARGAQSGVGEEIGSAMGQLLQSAEFKGAVRSAVEEARSRRMI